MEEKEAKTKICPQLQVMATKLACHVGAEGGSEEKIKTAASQGYCLGSDCMMWEPYDYYKDPKGESCYATQNEAKTFIHVTGGDCGLKTKELECRG